MNFFSPYFDSIMPFLLIKVECLGTPVVRNCMRTDDWCSGYHSWLVMVSLGFNPCVLLDFFKSYYTFYIDDVALLLYERDYWVSQVVTSSGFHCCYLGSILVHGFIFSIMMNFSPSIQITFHFLQERQVGPVVTNWGYCLTICGSLFPFRQFLRFEEILPRMAVWNGSSKMVW